MKMISINSATSAKIDLWTRASNADKLSALASLGSLPSRAVSARTLDKASYLVALDGVTRYSLTLAVRRILQGALGHGFFPSPPELRMQCDEVMRQHRIDAEHERRRRLEDEEFNRLHGNPPPKTPESIARVRRMYEDFLRNWRRLKYGDERDEREAARKRLGLSSEALARIPNLPPRKEDILRLRDREAAV